MRKTGYAPPGKKKCAVGGAKDGMCTAWKEKVRGRRCESCGVHRLREKSCAVGGAEVGMRTAREEKVAQYAVRKMGCAPLEREKCAVGGAKDGMCTARKEKMCVGRCGRRDMHRPGRKVAQWAVRGKCVYGLSGGSEARPVKRRTSLRGGGKKVKRSP